MYAQLLMDLFKFLTPFLRNAELTKPAQLLYKVRKVVQQATEAPLSLVSWVIIAVKGWKLTELSNP